MDRANKWGAFVALVLAQPGCGGGSEACSETTVELRSSSSPTETYEVEFEGQSCQVVVPGPDGFADSTPAWETCGEQPRQFTIIYQDPSRPSCSDPDDPEVGTGPNACLPGVLTRLLYEGSYGASNLELTLNGSQTTTVSVPRSCYGTRQVIDLDAN